MLFWMMQKEWRNYHHNTFQFDIRYRKKMHKNEHLTKLTTKKITHSKMKKNHNDENY